MMETVWVLVELVVTVTKLVQGLEVLVTATGMVDEVAKVVTAGCAEVEVDPRASTKLYASVCVLISMIGW
jgi:hypothetical protein